MLWQTQSRLHPSRVKAHHLQHRLSHSLHSPRHTVLHFRAIQAQGLVGGPKAALLCTCGDLGRWAGSGGSTPASTPVTPQLGPRSSSQLMA